MGVADAGQILKKIRSAMNALNEAAAKPLPFGANDTPPAPLAAMLALTRKNMAWSLAVCDHYGWRGVGSGERLIEGFPRDIAEASLLGVMRDSFHAEFDVHALPDGLYTERETGDHLRVLAVRGIVPPHVLKPERISSSMRYLGSVLQRRRDDSRSVWESENFFDPAAPSCEDLLLRLEKDQQAKSFASSALYEALTKSRALALDVRRKAMALVSWTQQALEIAESKGRPIIEARKAGPNAYQVRLKVGSLLQDWRNLRASSFELLCDFKAGKGQAKALPDAKRKLLADIPELRENITSFPKKRERAGQRKEPRVTYRLNAHVTRHLGVRRKK